METLGLLLYGKDELELTGSALGGAREKAKLEIPIAVILGVCYLLLGGRKLPFPPNELDPTSVVCSQIRILLIGLRHGGDLNVLNSLWGNLSVEIIGPIKVPLYNWSSERIFVSIVQLAQMPQN